MQNSVEKRDVYQVVTDRIIAKLEEGAVPWKRPWFEAGVPTNFVSKRPYRGVNVLLLSSLGFTVNYFLTSKQSKELGGTIKNGERPAPVIFLGETTPKNNHNGEDEPRPYPVLRYYQVYNISQCEGLGDIPPVLREAYPIPACESVVEKMPNKPSIRHKENKAYYNPLIDLVNVPKQEVFTDNEGYYSTLFHELIHSTGHRSRLNRKGLLEMHEFGSEPYSFEELIAEIGSCYLQNKTCIEDQQLGVSTAYIDGWLQQLKGDRKLIVLAAAQAQKAVDYILNAEPPQKEREMDAPASVDEPSDDLPF